MKDSIAGLFIESTIEVLRLLYSDEAKMFRRLLAWMMIFGISAIALGLSLEFLNAVSPKSSTFEQKMARLKETEAALKELDQFVDEQRRQLNESQQIIDSLRREHQTLQPMVESEREHVNAILAAYAEAQSWSIWRERLIGFGLGTMASILATILWTIGVRWWGKRKMASANESE